MKKSITILIFLYFFNISVEAQHDVRYGQAIFSPEMINPAYRWAGTIIQLDAVYRFPWKKNRSPQGGMFNFHSAVPGSFLGIGLRGDFYSGSSIRHNSQIGITLDYGWEFEKRKMLKIGTGIGINKEKFDFENIATAVTASTEDFDKTRIYLEFGAAFQYANLQIGLSAYSYSYYRMLFANACYNVRIDQKWELDPLVSYSAYKDFAGVLDLGAVIKYNKLAEIGLAYSTNDLINFLVQFGVSDFLNVCYSCGLATGDSTDLFKSIHEIGIKLLID